MFTYLSLIYPNSPPLPCMLVSSVTLYQYPNNSFLLANYLPSFNNLITHPTPHSQAQSSTPPQTPLFLVSLLLSLSLCYIIDFNYVKTYYVKAPYINLLKARLITKEIDLNKHPRCLAGPLLNEGLALTFISTQGAPILFFDFEFHLIA